MMHDVRAQLIFDSAKSGIELGTRAAGSGEVRSLLYQSGDVALDVVIQEGGAALRILQGQIVQRGKPLEDVTVVAGEQRDVTDEVGEFAITLMDDDTPAGLLVEAQHVRIECLFPVPLEVGV